MLLYLHSKRVFMKWVTSYRHVVLHVFHVLHIDRSPKVEDFKQIPSRVMCLLCFFALSCQCEKAQNIWKWSANCFFFLTTLPPAAIPSLITPLNKHQYWRHKISYYILPTGLPPGPWVGSLAFPYVIIIVFIFLLPLLFDTDSSVVLFYCYWWY